MTIRKASRFTDEPAGFFLFATWQNQFNGSRWRMQSPPPPNRITPPRLRPDGTPMKLGLIRATNIESRWDSLPESSGGGGN